MTDCVISDTENKLPYPLCMYRGLLLPAELVQTVPEHDPLPSLHLEVADLTLKRLRVRDQLSIICINHFPVPLFCLFLPGLETIILVLCARFLMTIIITLL